MTRRQRTLAAAAGVVVLALAAFGPWRASDPYAGALFEARPGPFVREVQAEGVLAAERATPVVAPIESGQAQALAWLAPDGARVKAGDVVARFDDSAMRRQLADGLSDEQAALGRLESARASSDAQGRGLVLERDVAAAESEGAASLQARDPAVFSRHEILTSELDRGLVDTRRRVAERKLALADELGGAQRGLAAVDGQRARSAIRTAQRALRALEVRAPHDGLLLLARDWRGDTMQVGRMVWPGEKLAEIPELGALRAKVYVLEADAGGLLPGLAARVTVEGQGGALLQGRVARVDPLAKPRLRGSPVRYFETVVTLDERGRGFAQGQRVRAAIVLDRLGDVIAVPRAAVFERDGRRLVHVLRGGRPVAVEVRVGRNSPSHVVIESGLAPGDRLLLRDPGRPLRASPSPRAEAAPAGGRR
jgi:multidrug resistance efflux pump